MGKDKASSQLEEYAKSRTTHNREGDFSVVPLPNVRSVDERLMKAGRHLRFLNYMISFVLNELATLYTLLHIKTETCVFVQI